MFMELVEWIERLELSLMGLIDQNPRGFRVWVDACCTLHVCLGTWDRNSGCYATNMKIKQLVFCLTGLISMGEVWYVSLVLQNWCGWHWNVIDCWAHWWSDKATGIHWCNPIDTRGGMCTLTHVKYGCTFACRFCWNLTLYWNALSVHLVVCPTACLHRCKCTVCLMTCPHVFLVWLSAAELFIGFNTRVHVCHFLLCVAVSSGLQQDWLSSWHHVHYRWQQVHIQRLRVYPQGTINAHLHPRMGHGISNFILSVVCR